MLLALVLGWACLLILPIFGFRRGSALALCVGLCCVLSGMLVMALAPVLSETFTIGFGLNSKSSLGWWSLALYLPLVIFSFPLGYRLHRFFEMSFDPFDNIIGFFIGGIFAFLTARTMLSYVLLAYTGTPEVHVIAQAFLVREVVHQQTWNELQQWVSSLNRPDMIQVE